MTTRTIIHGDNLQPNRPWRTGSSCHATRFFGLPYEAVQDLQGEDLNFGQDWVRKNLGKPLVFYICENVCPLLIYGDGKSVAIWDMDMCVDDLGMGMGQIA